MTAALPWHSGRVAIDAVDVAVRQGGSPTAELTPERVLLDRARKRARFGARNAEVRAILSR
jgi:hypothetical protein